jgi:hypothetical protein
MIKRLFVRSIFFIAIFIAHGLAAMEMATTFLGVAISLESLPVATEAVKYGADLNGCYNSDYKDGCSFLFSVMQKQYLPIFFLLVEKGADINREWENGLTPLLYAIRLKNKAMFTFLVQRYGINLNKRTKAGLAPLLYAASLGYFDMVKFMIKNGANITIRGKLGENVLHWAAFLNDFSAVKFLTERGAPVSACDASGLLPYHCTNDIGIKSYLETICLSTSREKAVSALYAEKFAKVVNKSFKKGHAQKQWCTKGLAPAVLICSKTKRPKATPFRHKKS